MSKLVRRCLSLALAIMLLASLTVTGTIHASADYKTGDGLAAYAMTAYNERWSYVWGGASYGAVDCSGLIYSYVGGGARVTEDMLYRSPESGYVSDGVPDIPGLGLWQPGHVGVYVGSGMAVDARDEISNVCYQSVSSKAWVMWFKVEGVSYGNDAAVTNDTRSDDSSKQNQEEEDETLGFGSTGSEVNELQERLKTLGFFADNTTQYFGNVTKAALEDFQKAAGLDVTGILDETTKDLLWSSSAPSAAEEENSDIENISDDEENSVVEDISDDEENSVVEDISDDEENSDIEDISDDEENSVVENISDNEENSVVEDIEDIQSDAENDDENSIEDDGCAAEDSELSVPEEQSVLEDGAFAHFEEYKGSLEESSANAYEEESGTAQGDEDEDTAKSEETADSENPENSENEEETNKEMTVNVDLNSSGSTQDSSDSKQTTTDSDKTTAIKSPKTGDNTLSVLVKGGIDELLTPEFGVIVALVTLVVMFFLGTVHYWNVSMEKRRQRARKSTTVSFYHRSGI